MDAIIAVVVTLAGVSALISAFLAGYMRGKKAGTAVGRQDAVTDLILAKDPEAWDKAHYLEVEGIEKRKKVADATTVVVRRPGPPTPR
jgi:hypothetical protein